VEIEPSDIEAMIQVAAEAANKRAKRKLKGR